MLKKWLILAGCFLGGILICGLGVGIGFAEFSTFTYVGDRQMGSMTEETLTYQTKEEIDEYHIYTPYHRGNRGEWLVSDNTLPKGTIEIEVQYNNDFERPYLVEDYYEYHAEETSETDGNLMAEETDEVSLQPSKKTVELSVYYDMDEMKTFMKYKDVILEDIKNKEIGSYMDDDSHYFNFQVRYSPELEERIILY